MHQKNLKQLWTALDGIKLKDAREAVGIDLYSLARNNTLSNAQLLELEEDGNSYFYSASIKYNVGKKLLNAFNLQTEYDRLSEEALNQSRAESIEVEAILQASSQAIQPEHNVTHSIAKKPLFILTAIVAICIAYAFVTYPSKSNKSQDAVQPFSASQVSNAEKSLETDYPAISTKTDIVSAVANTAPKATTSPKRRVSDFLCKRS